MARIINVGLSPWTAYTPGPAGRLQPKKPDEGVGRY